MPSADHEAVLLLLRERPEILVRLLREGLGVKLPEHREIRVRDADFTQLVPTEYRADLVVTLDRDRPVAAFVIEPQHSRDEQKRFSWPLYVAALHARVRCPTWLVVFAATDRLARWASRPIDTFHPGAGFTPLVLAPRDIPRITSVDEAVAAPELAVLSARAHGNDAGGARVSLAAIAACAAVVADDPDRAKLYTDLVLSRLNDSARVLLEAEMRAHNYEYQSEFARRYYRQGREEGREEGHQQGRLAALRDACRTLLEARMGSVSADVEARLAAIDDRARLETLLRELAVASDAEAALAALEDD